ncbi:MAG: hypothetical protein H6581_29705 [Bacteroidia bacterium]|nr:hypothetical protein [Bacteroidia bacterium]
MKKTFFLFSFLLLLGAGLSAQTTTTTAGPTSGPTTSQIQAPPPSIPISYVYRVLYEAQAPLNTPFQVLLNEYYNKNCKVSCIAVYPNGDMTFRVEYGGGSVILTIDETMF